MLIYNSYQQDYCHEDGKLDLSLWVSTGNSVLNILSYLYDCRI